MSDDRDVQSPEPKPGRLDAVGAAVFALLGVLSQLPTYDRSIVPMDEGHHASVALWLLNGKHLYQDLHSGIFPGIYQLTAILFEIFGYDLIVTRWAEVVANTSIGVCLWLIGARIMRPVWAAVAPLLYLALVPASFPVLAMFNYSSLACALAVATLLFVLRYLDEGRRADAIALGALLALCVIVKQNFGALAFVACWIAIIAFRSGSALEGRTLYRAALPVAAAGIVVTLPVLAYFVATGTLDDLLFSTVIQLGGDQLQSFNNPMPPIFGRHPAGDPRFVFLYTPPSLFNTMLHGETVFGAPVSGFTHSVAIRLSYGVPLGALVASPLLLWRTRGRGHTRAGRGTRIVVSFSLLFFLGIFPSAIWSHLAFIVAPILLLLGLIGEAIDDGLSSLQPVSARAWQVLSGALVVGLSVAAVGISMDIARWHPTPLDLPRAALKVSPAQARIYHESLRFIEECAPEGEPVFIAPTMPVLYFLADRMNPTRYDLTIPGDVDDRVIIESLHASGTRCIVYDPVMYTEFPPFKRLFPGTAAYIQRNFTLERRMEDGRGTFWLGLLRRPAAPLPTPEPQSE